MADGAGMMLRLNRLSISAIKKQCNGGDASGFGFGVAHQSDGFAYSCRSVLLRKLAYL